ncbi:MAG TPA: GGDEF domain-containing protein [Gammaproteobacteria bacterium]|nr:GGDEF domain-containing protein [Gammaproteobacteria bacterium]
MKSKPVQSARPTIALLVDGLIEDYEVKVWSGVREAAKKRGANLLCFACGTLASPHRFSSQRNILLDLVENAVAGGQIDGIIALTGALANFSTPEEVLKTYARFSKVPLISIGARFDGIPGIVTDNAGGMYDIISHLIKHHGKRRIAFIRGPEQSHDAQERFETYKKVLKDCALPFDPDLVAPGDWLMPSGKLAIELLMDERKVEFDAVVGANDGMAIDAMKALLARGIKVPEEIAVAGFDDAKEARSAIPGLTSVKQPGKELGMRAAGVLLDMLGGGKAPLQELLQTRLVFRESCGCNAFVGSTIGNGATPAKTGPLPEELSRLAAECGRNFSAIGEALENGQWLDNLLKALRTDLEHKTPSANFLPLLKGLAARGVERGLDIAAWQELLDLLFTELAPHIGPDNPLPLLAFSAMNQLAESVEVLRRIQYEEQTLLLYRVYQRLSASLDMDTLREITEDAMPRLQIESFYIFTYPGAKANLKGNMHPVIAVENGQDLLAQNRADFPSGQILPGGLKQRNRQFSFAVYALFLEYEQIGYAVYDMSRNVNSSVYEVLSGQLSNVLESSALFEEVRNHAKNLEAEVEQRTADLRKKTQEVEQLNEELIRKNKIDSLTALYNRGALFEFLRGEMNRVRRMYQKIRKQRPLDAAFSIMMLDIDHFKKINDTHGHLVGDRVLKQIGNMLNDKTIFRREDIAGRFGGEEFTVVLINTSAPNAAVPAKKLMDMLGNIDFKTDDGRTFKVTVSIGISQFHPEDANEEAVVNRADKALYHAKETGRNKIVVYEEQFRAEGVMH